MDETPTVKINVRNYYVVAVRPRTPEDEGGHLIESHRSALYAHKASSRLRLDGNYPTVFIDAGIRLIWDASKNMYVPPPGIEIAQGYAEVVGRVKR